MILPLLLPFNVLRHFTFFNSNIAIALHHYHHPIPSSISSSSCTLSFCSFSMNSHLISLVVAHSLRRHCLPRCTSKLSSPPLVLSSSFSLIFTFSLLNFLLYLSFLLHGVPCCCYLLFPFGHLHILEHFARLSHFYHFSNHCPNLQQIRLHPKLLS